MAFLGSMAGGRRSNRSGKDASSAAVIRDKAGKLQGGPRDIGVT